MSRSVNRTRVNQMLRQVAPGGDLEALKETLPAGESEEAMATDSAHARAAIDKLAADQADQMTDEEQRALEAIVMPVGRPVVFVRNDKYDPLPPPWIHLNDPAVRQRLEPLLPSVGRIDLSNNSVLPFAGTGFVVGPDLVMTNRHVARLFVDGIGTRRLTFRPGEVKVDFNREMDVPEDDRLEANQVRQVVMVHPYWDMALLRVDGLPSRALTLSVTPPEELADREIVTVGHPTRDPRSDLAVQDRVFGRVYDVKRIMPGKVQGRREIHSFGNSVDALTYDSSTLGGNSGAAVIDVQTGQVIGLHFASIYLVGNSAVPMYELARDPRVVDAGVNFAGHVPGPAPWDWAWARADGRISPETMESGAVTGTAKAVTPPRPSPSPMAAQFEVPQAPAGQRFESLDALRAAHAALLNGISAERLSAKDEERVRDFLERAAATGTILDAPADRRLAQGLIDYWVASLLTDKPDQADTAGGPARAVSRLLSPFSADTVKKSIDTADAWIGKLPPEDQALVRRIMLRLVRLSRDGKSFETVPAARAALFDVAPSEAKVNELLDRLAQSGVIRIAPGDTTDADQVTLRSPALLTDWERLAGWLRERKEFREKVHAWDRTGRPRDELLQKDALDEVRIYHDRNDPERAFIEQSRYRELRKNERNRLLAWLFGGLTVFSLVAAGAAIWGWVAAAREEDRATGYAKNISDKQQLVTLATFVRDLAEMATARSPAEQRIAIERWQGLAERVQRDDQYALLRQFDFKILQDQATAATNWNKIRPDTLREIRSLRNPVIANPEVYPALDNMRTSTFRMAKLCAQNIVNTLRNRPFSEAEPYVREFWALYWGDMVLVEGPEVEAAMVRFGKALNGIETDIQRPTDAVEDRIATYAQRLPPDKARLFKQQAQLLNATTVGQMQMNYNEIEPEAFTQLLRETKLRKVPETRLRPLRGALQPLLDALNRELKSDIPTYSDAKEL
jgi:S1-C subfamily serine protease